MHLSYRQGLFLWILGFNHWLSSLSTVCDIAFFPLKSVPHLFFSQLVSICFRDYILNGRFLFMKAHVCGSSLSEPWDYLYIGTTLSCLYFNIMNRSLQHGIMDEKKTLKLFETQISFGVAHFHWQHLLIFDILIMLGLVTRLAPILFLFPQISLPSFQ